MSKKVRWRGGGPGRRMWSAIGALVLVSTFITLGGAAVAATAAACNAGDEYTPCISVQPMSAAPGQSVQITGTGWATYGSLGYDVGILFGFTPQGDFVADPVPSSTGTFTVKVTVPTDAPLGATTVYALLGDGGSVTIPFTVTSAPTPSCSPLLFLGAHGVNEGSSSNWGPNIQAVWTAFNKQLPAALGEPVPYGVVPLDWLHFSTVSQALALQKQAKADAQVLETQMYNQFTACGTRTRFVLAGYSFGAWVVDLALRGLNSTVAGKLILAQVAGAVVMGDPTYPVMDCKAVGIYQQCHEGVATYFGAGYPKTSQYLSNGLSNFTGYCLSYSDTYLDPVCFGYGPSSLFTTANIQLHETGYQTSGLAARLGGVLAGYAK
jgi:Cutinase